MGLVYPLVMTITVCELEHGPVETVSCPMKNGGSFHTYVKLPEGKCSNGRFPPTFVYGVIGGDTSPYVAKGDSRDLQR